MNAYYVPGTVSNLTYLIFKAYFRDSMDIFYSKKKKGLKSLPKVTQ